MAAAGDVNADGFDDLIIDAWLDNITTPDSGAAKVLCGKTGAVLYTFRRDMANERFGWSVSGAGDVDGDGFADIIAGAHHAAYNGTLSGRAKVFSLGFDGTPPKMRAIGAACPGSDGRMPRIDYRGRLAVGETTVFRLHAALPDTVVGLVLGNPTDTDLGLTWRGLVGCRLYASLDMFLVYRSTDSDGMARVTVNLPEDSNLIGWQLNAQWGCFDNAANAFGVVGSNGLAMTIGS